MQRKSIAKGPRQIPQEVLALVTADADRRGSQRKRPQRNQLKARSYFENIAWHVPPDNPAAFARDAMRRVKGIQFTIVGVSGMFIKT